MMEAVTKRLGQICDEGGGFIRTGPFGSQLHKSDYDEDGTPVIMPKNIIDGKVYTGHRPCRRAACLALVSTSP